MPLPDETLKADPAAGAPAKRIDEALAAYRAALHLMSSNPGASLDSQTTVFSAALRHANVTRDVVANRIVHSPSAAQRVVHLAQKAGLVEGDVFARLGIRED